MLQAHNSPACHCTGRRKDKQQSDSMEDACDAVQLPWLLKKAVLVLNTLEVCTGGAHHPPPSSINAVPGALECTLLRRACTYARLKACLAAVAMH